MCCSFRSLAPFSTHRQNERLEHVAVAGVAEVVAEPREGRAEHVAVSGPEFRLPLPQTFCELVGEESGAHGVEEAVVCCARVHHGAHGKLLDVPHPLEDPRVHKMPDDGWQVQEAVHGVLGREGLLQQRRHRGPCGSQQGLLDQQLHLHLCVEPCPLHRLRAVRLAHAAGLLALLGDARAPAAAGSSIAGTIRACGALRHGHPCALREPRGWNLCKTS
mmetsp:Transcript_74823/g.232228  ORF Transcript_74823/g.232228 Transcript_74823/m.232228 type:complete len:218 (-) Transcript_74823:3-656(-)